MSNENNSHDQIHPENVCKTCNGYNPLWYADNDLFNKVNGSPYGIICPGCFEKKAAEMNICIQFKANVF